MKFNLSSYAKHNPLRLRHELTVMGACLSLSVSVCLSVKLKYMTQKFKTASLVYIVCFND